MSATGELIPVDADARALVTTTGLDRTLFVEAGAGTGKTTALVARIVSLVTVEDIDLRTIAAITFTEAAAAELRDRVRHELERASDHTDATVATRARRALDHVDAAPISTLHSFAQRLLIEHPLEVGIPPRVEVLDEVQSTLAFEARWSAALDQWLDDPRLEELITRTALLRIRLNEPGGASLRTVAGVLADNWDRLENWSASVDLDEPYTWPLHPIDLEPLHRALRAALALPEQCTNPDDKLATFIRDRRTEFELLLGDDPHRCLRMLAERNGRWGGNRGAQGNWPDVKAARAVLDEADAAANALVTQVSKEVLRRWLLLLTRFTLDAAHERTASGRLEFHDLLVLARRLLRNSPHAREALAARYRRLLLDEFQDTDPIQIELAVLLAATSDDGIGHGWSSVPTGDGALFFVGDPKQSIYRFRRADIGLFLDARQRFSGDSPVRLTQNFRTVSTVLDWVNHVFDAVMDEEKPRSQPRYEPLVAARAGHPDVDHRVVLLGGPHDDEPNASELRRREAADVAACIVDIRDNPDRWLVESTERRGEWRRPRFADIAILVPTRTSLPMLEEALSAAGVPFRADTSSLVFDTPELQELLTLLRAVDDPADQISVVAACRSPLFGCADTDLFDFHHANGSWDYRRPAPAGLPDNHPVVVARAALARWHEARLWLEPSALLERIIAERDVFAVALTARRPRDTWRRIRFLVDQARAFEEAGGGDLRAFLAWAELQRHETARVAEPLLPETDDDAVRILTFHGAKGLEFPITILSGLTTNPAGTRRGVQVLFDDDDVPHVGLNSQLSSDRFDARSDLEAEMDADEKQRLLYVGVTRARDHLVVSAHHKTDGKATHARTIWDHSQAVLGASCRLFEPPAADEPTSGPSATGGDADAPAATGGDADASAGTAAEAEAEAAVAERDRFAARRQELLARAARRTVWSATSVASELAARRAVAEPTAAAEAPADASTDIDPGAGEGVDGVATRRDLATDDHLDALDTLDAFDDLDLAVDDPDDERADAPVRRGRAGTAFGRAVHAVLQHATPTTSDTDLAEAAQAAADAEGIGQLADEVAAAARAALAAPSVQAAHQAPRVWRELFVAAPAVGDALLEGFVDLVADTPDGLVVIDYKTDRVAPDSVDDAVARYRPQAAAYALALERASGRPVRSCTFVFALPDGAIEREVDDLPAAINEVRALLAG